MNKTESRDAALMRTTAGGFSGSIRPASVNVTPSLSKGTRGFPDRQKRNREISHRDKTHALKKKAKSSMFSKRRNRFFEQCLLYTVLRLTCRFFEFKIYLWTVQWSAWRI